MCQRANKGMVIWYCLEYPGITGAPTRAVGVEGRTPLVQEGGDTH